MSRSSRIALVVGAVSALLLPMAPIAHAAQTDPPNLAGRWDSASLRMDDVGYSMRLAATSTAGRYSAIVRMTYQDGRRGPRLAGWVTVDGSRARLHVAGEGTVRGTLGQDGSLYFPRCHRVLDEAERAQRDTMCLFQEFTR